MALSQQATKAGLEKELLERQQQLLNAISDGDYEVLFDWNGPPYYWKLVTNSANPVFLILFKPGVQRFVRRKHHMFRARSQKSFGGWTSFSQVSGVWLG